MENPYEIIMAKLVDIENLLRRLGRIENPVSANGNATNEIFNTDQAAKYLSITKATLYKYTAGREVPHYKSGKKIYFKKAELDEWLTKNKINTNDEIDKMATEYILRKPLKGRRG